MNQIGERTINGFPNPILFTAASMIGMIALAGFFETKIAVDFSGLVPSADKNRVFTVETTTETLIEQATGTVRAKVETVISPLTTAAISSIAVRSGDRLKEGDIVARLDSRELDARVAQAHQAVVAARAGQARLLRTQHQKDEAETALSHSTLIAPISGRVVERYADPGDTARPGEPLVRMYDPQMLRLEANVRASVAAKLVKGQNLLVRIDALDEQFGAIVDEMVPSADPGSRSFLVKVSLKDSSGLYPGMFGRLMIPTGQIEKIYIPHNAVTRVGQLDFVIVKTQQGAVRRYVRLGADTGDGRVEIVSGLRPGEQILY